METASAALKYSTRLCPTVLAVVANEDEVYIAGVADQIIVGGNRYPKAPRLLWNWNILPSRRGDFYRVQ